MHIIFDWDGTLAKIDVAKEASIRRSDSFGKVFDSKWLDEALKTDAHFEINKKLIKEYTGVEDDKELTILMTDMFKYHYLGVANEFNETTLYEGTLDFLKLLKEKGFKLSIATTLRTDIVENVMKRLDLIKYFDHIAGNNASLDFSKKDLVKECIDKIGEASFMIGDKNTDVDAGKEMGAKGILVTWGTHKDYKDADLVVHDLLTLQKHLLKAKSL